MNSDNHHIMKSLEKGIRFDGRTFEEFRELKIEIGTTRNAEGSATVTLGDTQIMAGVKLAIDTPYPDTPDKGNLIVGAELLPMASPNFESGPPNIQSIEIARVVDRGIRESEAMDTKKLCLEPGEKVWSVTIDLVVINAGGNLIDAASLAAIAALKDVKMPKLVEGKIDYKEKTKEKLPLTATPIATTVVKIGDKLLVDATEEEEASADAWLTVIFLDDDKLCAMQKGGDEPLSLEEIDKIVELALKKSKELRKTL